MNRVMKELGRQYEDERAYACVWLHIFSSVGEDTRKDGTSNEALQKAGQIMPGNPYIHVSALWVCGL